MQEKKRENIKLFKLLNDEIFWVKFCAFCLSPYAMGRLREYRTKKNIPGKKLMKTFIETYKYIEKDDRNYNDIILDLLSEIDEKWKQK